jgi:hypothetical protein
VEEPDNGNNGLEYWLSEPEPSVSVTKLLAAEQQLTTALRLWFTDTDPVSTHTLAGAAGGIIYDLYHHKYKRRPAPFDPKDLPTGITARQIRSLLREAETFFKHARSDPAGTYNFDPKWTRLYFWIVISAYMKLAPDGPTPLMLAFTFYFVIHHPELFRVGTAPLVKEGWNVERLYKLSKQEFIVDIGRRWGFPIS